MVGKKLEHSKMENPKHMGEAPLTMRTAKYPYGSAADVIMGRMSGW